MQTEDVRKDPGVFFIWCMHLREHSIVDRLDQYSRFIWFDQFIVHPIIILC